MQFVFMSIDTTQQHYYPRIPRHHASCVLLHSLVYNLIIFYFVVSKISLIVHGFVIIFTSVSLIIFLSGWRNQQTSFPSWDQTELTLISRSHVFSKQSVLEWKKNLLLKTWHSILFWNVDERRISVHSEWQYVRKLATCLKS